MGRPVVDLVGQKFGKLLVTSFEGTNNRRQALWNCQCDCGNTKIASGANLKRGNVKSCGCLLKEAAILKGQQHRKHNRYEIDKEKVTLYTAKGEPVYIDKEDYGKVKDVYWENVKGYLVGRRNGERIKLHRYITNCPDDMVVDHINGNKKDNRKANLRVCTAQENAMNRGMMTNNTSGCTGVIWLKNDKRWCARITYKGKCYELGHFKDKSKAIEARKEAEKKYFKEWRYMIGGAENDD